MPSDHVGRPGSTGLQAGLQRHAPVLRRRPGRDLGDQCRRPAGSRPIAARAASRASRRSAEVGHVRLGLVRQHRRQQPAIGDLGGEGDAPPLLTAQPDRRPTGAGPSAGRWSPRSSGTNGSSRVTPSGVAASAENRALIVRTADSNRSNRSGIGGNGIPIGTCSGSNQPAPRPRMNRPPVDVVQHRRGLRRHRRMAERGRQHGVTEPATRDVVGEGRHRGHRLPAGAGAVLADIGEVVVHPDRLEDRRLADPSPDRLERRPVDGLRRGLDPDVERVGHRTSALAQVGGHPRPGRHRARGRGSDQRRVLGEDAAGVVRLPAAARR